MGQPTIGLVLGVRVGSVNRQTSPVSILSSPPQPLTTPTQHRAQLYQLDSTSLLKYAMAEAERLPTGQMRSVTTHWIW